MLTHRVPKAIIALLALVLAAPGERKQDQADKPKEKPAAEERADKPKEKPAAGERADKPKGEKPEGEEPRELSPENVAALIEELGSEQAERRSAAAKTLGDAKAAAAIPKLITMLDDPNEDAQWKATVALGAIGTPALPRIIDALNHEKERARWKAESALKMIREDAVPALVEALGDKRVRIRQSAAFLLGEIKDPRSLEGLAAAMGDKDEDTRWKAATSLTKLGRRATPAALKQLAAESIEARRCAAWVFQQTCDAEAVPDLAKALKDRDDQVRWKAAIALQKIGAEAAEPLLKILRSNAREPDKAIAAWILEGIKDVKVQTALRDIKGSLSRGGKETPTRPRPKTLPKHVALAITSAPTKATVFIDDKYAGVTPFAADKLAPGHHFIKLTKRDHLPWTKLVELLYAEEKINAKLAVKPKGTILVTSQPPEADVYIDGEYEGKTPFTKKGVDANPYTVRVEKEHFVPSEADIEVRAGQQVKVAAVLKSKVEGWYLARLKANPNDVSCHTELAHYHLVGGQLDKAAKSIAAAVAVMANGADSSGYSGRLVQEVRKMWNQSFQFGGGLEIEEVRRALHAAIHATYTRHKDKPHISPFLNSLRKATGADFTTPPR